MLFLVKIKGSRSPIEFQALDFEDLVNQLEDHELPAIVTNKFTGISTRVSHKLRFFSKNDGTMTVKKTEQRITGVY